MRLWHYDMIPVLPNKQLVAQWRECCAIASNIANKGTPNHLLVDKVQDYAQVNFIIYCNMIINEMRNRSYKISEASYKKLVDNLEKSKTYFFDNHYPTCYMIFKGWHNDRYLKQCYYNLQEKYDCGGIPEDEWKKIERWFKKRAEREEESNYDVQ